METLILQATKTMFPGMRKAVPIFHRRAGHNPTEFIRLYYTDEEKFFLIDASARQDRPTPIRVFPLSCAEAFDFMLRHGERELHLGAAELIY